MKSFKVLVKCVKAPVTVRCSGVSGGGDIQAGAREGRRGFVL